MTATEPASDGFRDGPAAVTARDGPAAVTARDGPAAVTARDGPAATPAGGEEESRDGVFVRSLERGLAVIRALDGPAPCTLSEVARSTGLTRATARRFLLTLERLGYVRQRDGRFALTPQVLDLGFAYLSSLTLPEVAGPHLAHLVEQVHESSSVSVLDGDEVVYVARVPARRIMTVTISVGTRFPAYATSMGRVLLAGLTPPERAARLAAMTLSPITPQTLIRTEQLLATLDQVARQGYAIVDQELEIGLRAVAVPIHNPSGQVVAAINLSVHAGSAGVQETRQRLLPPLKVAAEAITRDLACTSGVT